MSTLSDKRQTTLNYQSEILEARVIANYGDPGLDEDYHFDILSRYVIVMIESCKRVVTKDKYAQMIVMVKRPRQLWIDAVGSPDGNPSNQKRKDYAENMSVGLAGSFSSNGISRIYPSYSFGEVIKIRRMANPIQPPATDTNTFNFFSSFTQWDATTWGYGNWHSEGSTLPYFKTIDMKTQLRQKTIEPVGSPGYYAGILFKMQYEAFALSLNQGDSNLTNGITSIFDGTWGGNPSVYSANGGYIFGNSNDRIYLNYVGFEDTNVGQKARVATNECIPMVVTTPYTFPVPSARSIGTIIYNPTYSPIAK
jgi:hypothetical protein